jgi:predicted peptidase
MKRLVVLLSVVMLITVGLMGLSCSGGLSLFERKTFINSNGETLPYRLLVPQRAEKRKRYPLVIFFHGAGERGEDNEKQLINGARLFVKTEILKDYPCYMVAPQCPLELKWVDTDWKLNSHIQPDTPATPLRLSMELVHELIKTYPIDTERIYITGMSMGGFATWDAITRYPGFFAAAAPVCGGGDTSKAFMLKDFPVWAFHGGKDKLVKP